MTDSRLSSLKRFLNEELWQVNTQELPRLKRMGYHTLKIAMLTARQIVNDHILDRAASITYTTLFSIIPILALLFAIANGFGFGTTLQEQMRENSLFLNQQSELVFSLIDSYLVHAQSGVFIGAGIVMLFVSVYFLSSDIEQNINAIWQSQKPRQLLRMVTDYFSMLFLIPILIIVTSGITIFMTTYVQKVEGFLILGPLVQFIINLIPYFITCCIFMGIYVFVPNTHVKFRHVIIPGILAGSAFQAFQYFYINSQIWMSSYNAIYGSFAAIPLFLFWANISWAICLTGVEISYLSQNLSAFSYESEKKKISRQNHDFLAILVMSQLCKRLAHGEQPYTAEQLSKEMKLPIRMTNLLLKELVACRLAYVTMDVQTKNTMPRYIPGVDISQATIGMLMQRLDTYGDKTVMPESKLFSRKWEQVMELRDGVRAGGRTLLKDL